MRGNWSAYTASQSNWSADSPERAACMSLCSKTMKAIYGAFGQVVLHVEQRTPGQWRKVGRNELPPGQCWVYRPPVEVEPEVAADVQWAVEPENAVEFHSEYQLDKTRVATVRAAGKISLTPLSKVKCEE